MLPCMNRPAQRPSVAAGALVSARAQDAGFGPFRTAGSIVMLHGTLNRTADRRPLSSVCVTSAQWSVSAAMRSNGAQVALDPAIARRVAARKPAPLLLRAGLSSGFQPIPDGPSITGATSHGAVTGRQAEHKLDAKHWKAFTRPREHLRRASTWVRARS